MIKYCGLYAENGVHLRYMYQRLSNLLKSNSFFLFGPRGCGKTSLIKNQFKGLKTLWLDLLEEELYRHYLIHPEELLQLDYSSYE